MLFDHPQSLTYFMFNLLWQHNLREPRRVKFTTKHVLLAAGLHQQQDYTRTTLRPRVSAELSFCIYLEDN